MKKCFAEVRCEGKTRRNSNCTSYLGHVQMDANNTAYFHCRECGKTKEVTVLEGLITERIISKNERIFSPENPIRIKNA